MLSLAFNIALLYLFASLKVKTKFITKKSKTEQSKPQTGTIDITDNNAAA
jgi:hypothetical protein